MDLFHGFSCTTCWTGVQYGFWLFSQFWTYSPLKLALPNFPFLFCLFSDTITFTLSLLSLRVQQNLQFPVLGGECNIQNLFIYVAILRHLVPHGQFVTMWNARGCPWGWPVVIPLPDTEREKKKEVKGGKESGVERDWTWQRPWNRSVPLSRVKGVCSEVVSTSH